MTGRYKKSLKINFLFFWTMLILDGIEFLLLKSYYLEITFTEHVNAKPALAGIDLLDCRLLIGLGKTSQSFCNTPMSLLTWAEF